MQPETINQLKKKYGLAQLEDIQPLGGLTNTNYVALTEKGKVAIRQYAGRNCDRIRIEHGALEHLISKGFPYIAKPLHAVDYDTTTEIDTAVCIDERVYTLFEYIDGHTGIGTLEETIDAGKKLGLYHNCLDDFGTNQQKGKAKKTIETSDANLKQMYQYKKLNNKIISEKVKKAINRVKQTNKKLKHNQHLRNIPQVHNHADYHPGNVIYDCKGEVLAIIDMEASYKYGPRIRDVVSGALFFSGDYSEYPKVKMNMPKFTGFIKTYHQYASLSNEEINLLPAAFIGYLAEYTATFIDEAIQEGLTERLREIITTYSSHIVTTNEFFPIDFLERLKGKKQTVDPKIESGSQNQLIQMLEIMSATPTPKYPLLKRVRETITELLAAEPNYAPIVERKAYKLFAKKECDLTEEIAIAIIKAQPDNKEMWNLIGDAVSSSTTATRPDRISWAQECYNRGKS